VSHRLMYGSSGDEETTNVSVSVGQLLMIYRLFADAV
jgi:hypothetical protein